MSFQGDSQGPGGVPHVRHQPEPVRRPREHGQHRGRRVRGEKQLEDSFDKQE